VAFAELDMDVDDVSTVDCPGSVGTLTDGFSVKVTEDVDIVLVVERNWTPVDVVWTVIGSPFALKLIEADVVEVVCDVSGPLDARSLTLMELVVVV